MRPLLLGPTLRDVGEYLRLPPQHGLGPPAPAAEAAPLPRLERPRTPKGAAARGAPGIYSFRKSYLIWLLFGPSDAPPWIPPPRYGPFHKQVYFHKADEIAPDHYLWQTMRQTMRHHPDTVVLTDAPVAPTIGVTAAGLGGDDASLVI
jgi:hypothetical protein